MRQKTREARASLAGRPSFAVYVYGGMGFMVDLFDNSRELDFIFCDFTSSVQYPINSTNERTAFIAGKQPSRLNKQSCCPWSTAR
jgi:hypothetical protein